MNTQNPIARNNGLVVQEAAGETLIYDVNSNKAHCLNATAAFVWKVCDGNNSVADINNLMEKEFGTPVHEDLIWLAIDQLGKDNLLENIVESKVSGLSRRDVIKRIGLASVVALPVVASLVAPTSALAVSCSGTVADCAGCPNGIPCDVNMDGMVGSCASGLCTGD
jgi:hypothetical protein